MSSPKITPRPPRLVRTENDPYQFDPALWEERRGFALIRRLVHDDGSRSLFVGRDQVRSMLVDHDALGRFVLLGILDGRHGVALRHVGPDEERWLRESLGRPPQ